MMCEVSKSQQRRYRDQDPPRILEAANNAAEHQTMEEPAELFRKHQQRREEASIMAEARGPLDSTVSSERDKSTIGTVAVSGRADDFQDINTVPFVGTIIHSKELITNGVKTDPDSCESLTNGKEMAPVMGVPPPPPPAPHMGPDGLIQPRKPYNPCLNSNNHKDLRRELLFNQKIGKSVLNQKSELERALERHRASVVRREAQKQHEESYKDDPRTPLQKALEQRARQIELMEHPPVCEPPNPLVTARAKLRTRMDSQ